MDIYLIKIIIAHLIGDFFLQPNKWVKEKEKKKLRSNKLYMHIAVHIILIFIVFGQWDVWRLALLIGFFHLIIDGAKLVLQNQKNTRILFFVDQLLHFISIYFIWEALYGGHLDFSYLYQANSWLILAALIFLTMPASIIMRVIIAKWIPDDKQESSQSLQNAGKYIGVLERLLIFLFVCTNHFEAVGFLLAAKSIFRFGDLKDAHDIKLTEYVLIGTLLSFGMALVVSLLLVKFIA